MNKSKKIRFRKIIIFLSIIFLVLSLFLSVNDNLEQIFYNKKTAFELDEQYEELANYQILLESEVRKLNDPEYVIRYAKEKYFYSENGEVIIKFD